MSLDAPPCAPREHTYFSIQKTEKALGVSYVVVRMTMIGVMMMVVVVVMEMCGGGVCISLHNVHTFNTQLMSHPSVWKLNHWYRLCLWRYLGMG